MSLAHLLKIVNPFELLARQTNNAYRETLFGQVTVPAAGEATLQVNVSNKGDFQLERLTASYTTLSGTAPIIDDGVNYLSAFLSDGSNMQPLFNDYVPAELISSPGRVRDAAATNNTTTAGNSNALFYPFEFSYVFPRNGSILVKVKNTSTAANTLKIAFHGVRLIKG